MDIVRQYVLLCPIYCCSILPKVSWHFLHSFIYKEMCWSNAQYFQILHLSSCWYTVRFGCSAYVGIKSHLSYTSRSSVRKNNGSTSRRYHCPILWLLLPCLANRWIVGKSNFKLGAIVRCTWGRRRWKRFIVVMRCQFLCRSIGRKCQFGTSTRFRNFWNFDHLFGLYRSCRFNYCFVLGSLVKVQLSVSPEIVSCRLIRFWPIITDMVRSVRDLSRQKSCLVLHYFLPHSINAKSQTSSCWFWLPFGSVWNKRSSVLISHK